MEEPDELVRWFRRGMNVMGREAERGHGGQVQRRTWAAIAASAYGTRRQDAIAPTEGAAALRHLDPLAANEWSLLSDFVALAPGLPWKPSTRTDPEGVDVVLLDLFDCLNLGIAGAGVMLLGPGAGYPEHQHRPAEVYLVLHGSRRWRFGGSDRYLKVDQGQVLSNSSMDIHGIEAGDDTLLALWVLMDDRY